MCCFGSKPLLLCLTLNDRPDPVQLGCFQEGSVAISMTPTLPCPFPQICHAYKVLATCKSAVSAFIWTPVDMKMRILHLQPTCDCMLVLAAQSPRKLFLHVNHMALVSPSAHPHRPPDILPSPCCTPSQTPGHPSLPLLHTLTDPQTASPPTVAHPHRPPDSLPSHCCTPSQTPRQPPLPLLHTIAKASA